jgi:hypothetical protein
MLAQVIPLEIRRGEREGPAAVPVDITLLYDRSGSKGDAGASGVEAFRKGLLDEFPNVRIAIYGLSDHARREGAEPGLGVGVFDCAPVNPFVFEHFVADARVRFGAAGGRDSDRAFRWGGPTELLETSGSVLQTARRARVEIPMRATVASTMKGEPRSVIETADVEMHRLRRTQQAMGDGMSIAGYRRLAESGGQFAGVVRGDCENVAVFVCGELSAFQRNARGESGTGG